MNYVKLLLQKLWNQFLEGSVFKAMIAIWIFFAGIHSYVYIITALTIIDVVTGLMKAVRISDPITSRKLRKGLLEKLCIYLILLISVFFIDTLMAPIIAGYYLSFVITVLIAFYELTSVSENLSVLMPQIPFLKGLVRIFRKLGEKTVDGLDKKVDSIVDTVTDFKPNTADPPASDIKTPPDLPEVKQ
ncbi:phage holin family protein [Flaviaesturariibacter amylovorans]|uniref:Holin n=1 Tax=Flaviaesturariibacter amylovorans TaxID=1084520 RepID=A0ABP8GL11_9BACT